MRCGDCNRFVSFGEGTVEDVDVAVEDAEVRVSGRVVLPCGECGTELKEWSFDDSFPIEHDCEKEQPDDEEEQFEVESEGDFTATERTETKDRHGKPIKNSRYMKTYRGFEGEVLVKCLRCGETGIAVQCSGEEQASGFDEIG